MYLSLHVYKAHVLHMSLYLHLILGSKFRSDSSASSESNEAKEPVKESPKVKPKPTRSGSVVKQSPAPALSSPPPPPPPPPSGGPPTPPGPPPPPSKSITQVVALQCTFLNVSMSIYKQ